jgi:hypothetical protein
MARGKLSYDIFELRAQIYWELPADISPIRNLLEQYSGVAPADVERHILAIVSDQPAQRNACLVFA